MKNSKKKKNNSKLIIICSAIVLLLAIALGVLALIYKIDKREKEKKKVENDPIAQKKPEDKAKDMLYNNYLISYILEGDVQIGEGTLTIEETGEVYYAVTDILLSDIHTISDIYKLIENNLTDDAAARARKLMESPYANQYTYNDDTLYVIKTAAPCAINGDEPIEKDKAEYRLDGKNTYIVYKNIPYQGYYDEKSYLKASTLWFACSLNFPHTKTGKDDVYDPNYVPEDYVEIEPNTEGQDTSKLDENGEN